MTKQMCAIMKGVAVGSVIGTAAYMMANTDKRKTRALKKNTGRAMNAFGDKIENVAYIKSYILR